MEYLGDDIINSLSLLEDVEIVDLEVEATIIQMNMSPQTLLFHNKVLIVPQRRLLRKPLRRIPPKKPRKLKQMWRAKE